MCIRDRYIKGYDIALSFFLLGKSELEQFISDMSYEMTIPKLRAKLTNERLKFQKRKKDHLDALGISST